MTPNGSVAMVWSHAFAYISALKRRYSLIASLDLRTFGHCQIGTRVRYFGKSLAHRDKGVGIGFETHQDASGLRHLADVPSGAPAVCRADAAVMMAIGLPVIPTLAPKRPGFGRGNLLRSRPQDVALLSSRKGLAGGCSLSIRGRKPSAHRRPLRPGTSVAGAGRVAVLNVGLMWFDGLRCTFAINSSHARPLSGRFFWSGSWRLLPLPTRQALR